MHVETKLDRLGLTHGVLSVHRSSFDAADACFAKGMREGVGGERNPIWAITEIFE